MVCKFCASVGAYAICNAAVSRPCDLCIREKQECTIPVTPDGPAFQGQQQSFMYPNGSLPLPYGPSSSADSGNSNPFTPPNHAHSQYSPASSWGWEQTPSLPVPLDGTNIPAPLQPRKPLPGATQMYSTGVEQLDPELLSQNPWQAQPQPSRIDPYVAPQAPPVAVSMVPQAGYLGQSTSVVQPDPATLSLEPIQPKGNLFDFGLRAKIIMSLTTLDTARLGLEAWYCWLPECKTRNILHTKEQMVEHLETRHYYYTVLHSQRVLDWCAKGLDREQWDRLLVDYKTFEKTYGSINPVWVPLRATQGPEWSNCTENYARNVLEEARKGVKAGRISAAYNENPQEQRAFRAKKRELDEAGFPEISKRQRLATTSINGSGGEGAGYVSTSRRPLPGSQSQ
jgi:hypothetical protein